MDELQEQLNGILNDPVAMQKILSMAQALGGDPSQNKQEHSSASQMPDFDLGMVQKLSGLASQSSIDKREQALLRALGAYLSKDRIGRLEKAMRAAKMAKLASSTLGQGGLLSSMSR
jgi:hypothetical protein